MNRLSSAWHVTVSGFLVVCAIALAWLVAHVAALPTGYPATPPYPTPLPTATPWDGSREHCTVSNQVYTQDGTGEVYDVRCVPLQP